MGHESGDASSGTERALDSTALPQAKNGQDLKEAAFLPCWLISYFSGQTG